MKSIITHLKSITQFKKINSSKNIDNIIKLLPMKLSKGIKFTYIKNQILFFALTHPVYRMEFEYNKENIKSILKKSNIANIQDVKFFVTNKNINNEKSIKKDIPKYQERSYAIFENSIKNEKLKLKFEEIRQIIKNQKPKL